ncbi:hypothetical protein TBLA_0F03810 [Henningerozyma blattae CBS 6284]|uniref:Phospholipid-transporting ATPase n=1 Tax=Henningerozyma blattae (strain ATCC 34711 / CBS 6284 / DSM 70876 / NBRC 10599 / NRRL Y-10934 / UCD 77-7) TaxID=1071380 RepID=I2H6B3_HENB6|nr:hypothetical protein TBLA_0F03810 [Tetrapisispora blattae CBS 6284]CCH61915.1 hypothetical protein TBLA_0F03810 [Tetrapisispora blattae CBS 6284]
MSNINRPPIPGDGDINAANAANLSPFDDTFRFTDDQDAHQTVPPTKRNGSVLKKNGEPGQVSTTNGISFNANLIKDDVKDEYHEIHFQDGENDGYEHDFTFEMGDDHKQHDNNDNDIHSFSATPQLNLNSGVFEDPSTESSGSASASGLGLNERKDKSSRNESMKRLRWGTRRTKLGNPIVGRAKTLKWAKENIQKPFEEFSGTQVEDPNALNRSDELRSIYYNLPLPKEMLDEDGKPKMEYARNKIRTTKYTPLTFFPKNIMFQFQNFANVYFLALLILGAFQIFGVTNPGFASVPLIVIVCITALKDAIEDSRRTVLDMEVNNTRTYILHGIENENVAFDNISLWRKFKKACTRMTFKVIRLITERVTESGKMQRAQRKRQELRQKRMSTSTRPRSSLDSFESIRMSGAYERPSMENTNPFEDPYQMSTGQSILDRSMPPRTDCKFKKDYWKNVKVGDIIRIHNNDEIPADVILISTSDSDGGCYVETKNLDGETNLKVRQSLKSTHQIRSSRDISRTKFWVESEGPHANLYSYQGNLKWMDTQANEMRNEPVTINETLLRGCTLRNTRWAIGFVIFTGDDTKIMLNAGVTPTKKSRISRELNFSVLLNFLLLFILCFISGIVNGVYYAKGPSSREYFEFGTVAGNASTNGFVSFWVAVILYQSLVPISLYISIEIIKTAQAAFIYGDVLLYNAKLDYPCTPKSWNISDDLGQIEYVFSDKTGTLTQNVMEFKKCTINGVSYGRAYTEALAGLRKRQGIDVESEGHQEREAIATDKEIMINDLRNLSTNSQFYPEDVTFISKEFVCDLKGVSGEYQQKCCEHFMLSLALCHSVLLEPSKMNPDKLELKAQSPDEAALVGTARDMGFSFIEKTKQGIVVEIQGVPKEFQILNVLEFNSTRKRMSCIVKIPPANPDEEPRALLICKGADSIIYSRLKTSYDGNDETLLEQTALHLEQYATEGLRTLCIAQRELSWSEYTEWNARHEVAAASLTNREEQLEIVADSIERDMILLGGTAIEDRLQDGVPDSIALLADAGIKLWVLTGDKVETAINIGFSCNLLNNDMELLVIKSAGDDTKEFGNEPVSVVEGLISKYLDEKFDMTGSEEELAQAKKEHDIPKANYGVVIDGEALKIALDGDDIKRKFLLLCKNCKVALCCRVSPAQKAAVVKLVKNTLDVMTLAIGDGSNDVAMIQSADVGVGIAGEEGRQAVMCSDYAIGQFRYLTRLLLVHGRWSYKRLAEMIPGFFYKNVIFTLALFWYGIYNDFDGSYLFEYTYLSFYNLAFTSLPIIFLGIFDQDVNDTVSLLVPQLYRVGILRLEWNQTKFLWYMLDGFYQSVISFFFPYLVYHKNMYVTNNGLGLDHRYYVGGMVCAIAVTACNLYILLHQYRWDWFCSLFVALSILVLFAWSGIWSSSITSGEFLKGASRIYGSPAFWGVLFVGVMFCLLPRFTFDIIQKLFYPKDIDIIREMWKRGDFDRFPEGYDPTDPNRPKITKFGLPSTNGSIIMKDINEVMLSSDQSHDSVITEEIPLDILKEDLEASRKPSERNMESATSRWIQSPRENQDLLFSPIIKE